MRSLSSALAIALSFSCATTSTEGSLRDTRVNVDARLSLEGADADRAAKIALENNRELRIAMEELGIVQAQRAAAYALPNPELSGSVRVPTGTGHSGVNLEGALSIDLLGWILVPAKADAANHALDAAKYRLADQFVKTALDAKIAFFRVQALEQLIGVETTAVETERIAMDFATRQFEAGTMNELDLTEEKMAFQEAELELADLQLEREAAKNELAAALGVDESAEIFGRFLPLPPILATEVSLDNLEETARENRLDLLAATAEKEAAEAGASVAAYQRLPSLHAGVSYEREPDGHSVVGPELELELPIFDLNRGEIAEREAEVSASAAKLSWTLEQIELQVRFAKKRLLAARTRVEYWEKKVLPVRASSVELAQQHYNLGALGVYDLLRAKKREVEARKSRIEALLDYWIARTELERAVGTTLGGHPLPHHHPAEEPAPERKHHHHHGGH